MHMLSKVRIAGPAPDLPRPEARLAATLSDLLGPRVCSAVAEIRLDDAALFPKERAYIGGAMAQRRAEFGTARQCAREALARLGFAPQALVPHADRSPAWPKGVVGSITHASTLCAAAVARAEQIGAIGLDIEDDRPLEGELLKMVCTPAEQAWLERRPSSEQGRIATMFFSAKEAFYKCQYGMTGRMLDFQDVELDLDPASGTFRLVAGCAVAEPRFEGLEGRVVSTQDAIVATAVQPSGIRA